mgnify:CR=1 FL=1
MAFSARSATADLPFVWVRVLPACLPPRPPPEPEPPPRAESRDVPSADACDGELKLSKRSSSAPPPEGLVERRFISGMACALLPLGVNGALGVEGALKPRTEATLPGANPRTEATIPKSSSDGEYEPLLFNEPLPPKAAEAAEAPRLLRPPTSMGDLAVSDDEPPAVGARDWLPLDDRRRPLPPP